MPMIPSPTAALIYAAVKLSGYAIFAHGLNKAAGRTVSPIKFSAAKTGLGLVAGITYVFAVAPAFGISERADAELFLGAAPLRMVVWLLVLGIFYGFRANPKLISAAVFVGVAWSYTLHGVMWLVYQVLPGLPSILSAAHTRRERLALDSWFILFGFSRDYSSAGDICGELTIA